MTHNLEGIRNAMNKIAARVPAVKAKKPVDFVDLRFLKEIEKEGFYQPVIKEDLIPKCAMVLAAGNYKTAGRI